MNRLFARVLLAMAMAILAYMVVASLLFWGLNVVRLQQFRENLARPLIAWVRQAPEDHVAVLRSVAEDVQALRVLNLDDLELSRLERERLEFGQILVLPTVQQDLYLAEVAPGRLLEIRWESPLVLSALWLARIVGREVAALAEDAGRNRLQYWMEHTGLELEVVSEGTADADQMTDPRSRAPWKELIRANPAGGIDEIRLSLPDGRVLLLSGVDRFNPWSFGMLAALVFTGLVMIAAALYLSLDNLDRRLRKLETVASRIARGELEARVDDSRFDAVGRLGQVFNRMAEHIQRLVGVQREMIHAVSHELRTPVARIRFGVQMIEDCTDELMRQKQLNGIDSDIQELNELIDEILTYARLEQGGPILDFQEVNLIDIAHQVVEEQRILKPGIVLEATTVGDSERWKMAQVEPRYIHRSLQNLVGNAMRYASGRVQVRCNFEAETCRIDVEDDGPGIPEADWEKVFTAFARLDDSRTRSSGGYGLGLSIVRRILYWHGGQAFVARSELGGAKFSLVWPRQQTKPLR